MGVIVPYDNPTYEVDRFSEGGTAISSPAMRNVIAAENKQ